MVRALPCHGRGRGFEPHPGRQFASVAQLVEQRTENPRVVGSIPTGGTSDPWSLCGFSSFGRAPPCQGGGGGFEPRNPLQNKKPSPCGSVFCFGTQPYGCCAVHTALSPESKSRTKAALRSFASRKRFRVRTHQSGLTLVIRISNRVLSVVPLRTLRNEINPFRDL